MFGSVSVRVCARVVACARVVHILRMGLAACLRVDASATLGVCIMSMRGYALVSSLANVAKRRGQKPGGKQGQSKDKETYLSRSTPWLHSAANSSAQHIASLSKEAPFFTLSLHSKREEEGRRTKTRRHTSRAVLLPEKGGHLLDYFCTPETERKRDLSKDALHVPPAQCVMAPLRSKLQRPAYRLPE